MQYWRYYLIVMLTFTGCVTSSGNLYERNMIELSEGILKDVLKFATPGETRIAQLFPNYAIQDLTDSAWDTASHMTERDYKGDSLKKALVLWPVLQPGMPASTLLSLQPNRYYWGRPSGQYQSVSCVLRDKEQVFELEDSIQKRKSANLLISVELEGNSWTTDPHTRMRHLDPQNARLAGYPVMECLSEDLGVYHFKKLTFKHDSFLHEFLAFRDLASAGLRVKIEALMDPEYSKGRYYRTAVHDLSTGKMIVWQNYYGNLKRIPKP